MWSVSGFCLRTSALYNIYKWPFPGLAALQVCFDDTTVFYSSKHIQTALSKISTDLKRLTDWFKANKLSLNIKKTNYMIFSNTRIAIPQHTLRIRNKILNSAAHTNFLGIIIDNRLSWHKHIDYCKKKMSSGLYAINASKRLLP